MNALTLFIVIFAACISISQARFNAKLKKWDLVKRQVFANSYQSGIANYQEAIANYQEAMNHYQTAMTHYQTAIGKYQTAMAFFQRTVPSYQTGMTQIHNTLVLSVK
jgi:hypothetical protein